MKHRCLALFMAVLMTTALLTGTAQAADNGDTAAREARNGVVRILTLIEEEFYIQDPYTGQLRLLETSTAFATGTGFGVGTTGKETDVFVTNRHVVTAEDEVVTLENIDCYVKKTVTGVYVLLDSFAFNGNTFELDNSRSVPCTVLYVGESEDADVAIIKTAEPVQGRVALPLLDDESSLQVMDKVSSLGYPGTSDVTSDGYKLAGVDDVTVQTGAVARISDKSSANNNSGLQGRLIQHSAVINHGNSGGPLIDQNGAVVGINTYGHGGSGNTTTAYYAIRIKYAKDALDSLEISYDLYNPKGGGLPIIPIAGGAVIVVIAAVVVLSKKKKPAAVGASAPQAPAAGKGFLAGKAKAAPAQTAQRAFIRSLAPQHNGLALVVKDTPILIGRDPSSCKLVYAEGTAGVSGQHCSISYDAASGDFIVTDLRSTYGTFLMNGQRLNANTPCRIKPGNGFYVGDKANGIRVELG